MTRYSEVCNVMGDTHADCDHPPLPKGPSCRINAIFSWDMDRTL